jgi:glycosyltransferase involved in cell wall biosynthesis
LLRRLREHDIVQFEFPTAVGWRRWFPGNPAFVYDAHNVEIDYHRDRVAGPLRGFVIKRVASLEAAAVGESDLVIACTEADSLRLTELYRPRAIEVVPNGVGEAMDPAKRRGLRSAARARLGLAEDERVLLFLGGRATHNTMALDTLEKTVLPELPGKTTLLVAGRCAKPGESRQGQQRVVRLGFVDDLMSVLAAADVALNPVNLGSGSSVKMADYLAAGLPVVSTPIGARGFEEHLQTVRVAAIADFPEAVQAVLRDEARASGAFDTHDLTVDALGRRLLAAYGSIIRA